MTLKPVIVTHCCPEMLNPFGPPLTVTDAPGAVDKTMGALEVPEWVTLAPPAYVPDMTSTVWPAVTTDAAFLSVQNGLAWEPGPPSEQLVVPTHNVVVAAFAGVPLDTA